MASKSNMMRVWLAALLVALVNLSGALAIFGKVGCNCHIGPRFESRKIINYGEIERYRRLSSGKQRDCANACSGRCAADIQNGDKVCAAIGTDYDNSAKKIGCFSVVGKSDTKNRKWDFDGRATFNSCKRTCTCPRGSYNIGRKSCVESTGIAVPLPDGDLRDGGFVLGGILYKDISGASCVVKAV